MEINGGSFSDPERYLSGLHRDRSSDDYRFAMPRLGQKGVNTSTSAALASLYSILDDKDKLPKASVSLKFIGFMAGKHVVGAAADIVVGQLFDTAVADTLRMLGDVSLVAASVELEDANGEPTEKGKKRHRMLAQGHLGVVYQAAEREIGALEKKLISRIDRRAEAHRKATIVAAAIALINRDAGMQAAVQWAERAKQHFGRYDTLKGRADRELVDRMNRQESKIRNGRGPIVIHPTRNAASVGSTAPYLVLRKTALRDLEEDRRPHLARLAVLDEERSQFELLYAALMKG